MAIAEPPRPRVERDSQSDRRARHYPSGEVIPGTVYRVRKVLGAGGMGTVYDVEDTTVGKRYVLKTLHPELGDRQDLARRMQNEARTLARLQHPNIVEVVTAGATADEMKLPYYVMERLDGQNLRVVIDKMRRIEPGHAYHITVDLLDALDHAHEAGVIHRDVKPDNIFLHRTSSGTTVTKLLDFGIMRLLDGPRGDTAGRFLGTLRYAAPEQLSGEPLTPQTDLYAAALVLYEMVAGRGPFDDVGDVQQIGRAHLKTEAPLLSVFAPHAPPVVVDLLRRTLSKDPKVRPRDAFTFAAELRTLLRDRGAGAKSARTAATTGATEVNVLGQVGTLAGAERVIGAATEAAIESVPATSHDRPNDAPPTAGSVDVQMSGAIDRQAATRTSAGEALRGAVDPAPANGTEALDVGDHGDKTDAADPYGPTMMSDPPPPHSPAAADPVLPRPPAAPHMPLSTLRMTPAPAAFPGYVPVTTAAIDRPPSRWTNVVVAAGSAGLVLTLSLGFYALGRRHSAQGTAPVPTPVVAVTSAPRGIAPSAAAAPVTLAPTSTALPTASAPSVPTTAAAPTPTLAPPAATTPPTTPATTTATHATHRTAPPAPSPPKVSDPSAPPRVSSGL